MGKEQFRLVAERELPELGAAGRLYRHEPTGLELLSLCKSDPSRVFGIAFRTLPSDSTGVAHILEHSVLCGSERYPVRKPFVELLKGSLQTYLNAVTLPDLTCYPVASPNETDFRNLVEVYLDAVFAPRLTAETFRQEAWRLEREASGELALHGVVYNEMKGYVSSPLGVVDEEVRRVLFPDNVYGVSYGGDWRTIPGLTHEALVEFHRRFYRPSNAMAFFCGHDEPDWQFDALGRHLDARPAVVPERVVPQRPFEAPRQVRAVYRGVRKPQRRDAFVAMAWALEPGMDAVSRLGWKVLDRLLVGGSAAILRRALVEAGLGEDLVLSGFSEHTLQPTFQVALSGVDAESPGRVETTVLRRLEVCARGLPAEEVEAALNSVEFALREGPAGAVPAGVVHLFDALTTWRHGGDPFDALAFEEALSELRRRCAAESVLERMVGRLLVTPHRVTVVLEADPKLAEREAAAERWRVETLVAGLGAEGRARLADDGRVLREALERPDPPQALASIPVLRLADLPATVPRDMVEVREDGRRMLLVQEMPTQGIVHLNLGLDLAGLPDALLPAARLLGSVLLQAGTARRDRVEVARWIESSTGGIVAQSWTATDRRGGRAAFLFLRGKALAERAEDLGAILTEVLREVRLDDPTRLREVVLQEKARAEARLVAAGHDIVDRRVRASLGPAGLADEAMHGVSYLQYLRETAAAMQRCPEGLGATLPYLRDRLLGGRIVCGVVADAVTSRGVGTVASDLLTAADAPVGVSQGGAAGGPASPTQVAFSGEAGGAVHVAEALEAPTQVNFVGAGGDLHAAGLEPSGAAEAAARYLANTWLWDRVRVRGGAYGAQCRLEPVSGAVTLLSYRDPHVLETLAAYLGAGAHLKAAPSGRDLTASIIATVGALDRPQPPGARGFAALERWLSGRDDTWRDARRQQLLGATAADFAAFGEALEAMAERVVVLGGPQALNAADAARPGWLRRTRLS